jgi:hypothetical protein
VGFSLGVDQVEERRGAAKARGQIGQQHWRGQSKARAVDNASGLNDFAKEDVGASTLGYSWVTKG